MLWCVLQQFAIAESLLKKVQERLEQIRKDVDVTMKSLLFAEKLGKQVNQVVRESHAKVWLLLRIRNGEKSP